jgi:tetratricopeptide (TPR) repeat protein
MVQARFDALDESARRALRAASVFGERFWRAGVERLLGDSLRPSDEWIAPLVEREMIVNVPDAKLAGESAHQFRHALVRDAAYAMLTEADRVLAHRLAGEWLAERGESDAALLARHFEIGGCVDRALEAYGNAALQALEGNDLVRAIEWAKRSIELGATGTLLAKLWVLLAEAQHWRAEYVAMRDAARAAAVAAKPGSAEWYQAKGIEANAVALEGDYGPLATNIAEISETPPEPDAERAQIRWLARTAIIFIRASRPQVPPWLKPRLEKLLETVGDTDRLTHLFVREALVTPLFGVFDLGLMAKTIAASVDELERWGDLREMAARAATAGFLLTEVGEYERAAEFLERSISVSDRLGLASVGAIARHNLGWCRLVGNRIAEAHELQLRALEMFERAGSIRLAAAAHLMLARECLATGDMAGAESHARAALERAPAEPRSLVEAYGYLADASRARGDLAAAREWATNSVAIYEKDRSNMLRFYGLSALAEVELAEGHEAEARVPVAQAIERIALSLINPSDPRLARGFLRTPDRARVVELAKRLGVDLTALAPYLD